MSRDIPSIRPTDHGHMQDEMREGTVPAPAWGQDRGCCFLPHKPLLTWTLASLRLTLLANSSRTKASG